MLEYEAALKELDCEVEQLRKLHEDAAHEVEEAVTKRNQLSEQMRVAANLVSAMRSYIARKSGEVEF